MQITDELVEAVAECIWQAEWKRAGNGGLRRVPWCEIGDKDQERYRFVAREVAALTAELAHGEPVAWHFIYDDPKNGRFEFFDTEPNPPQKWTSRQPLYTHHAPQPSGSVQALAEIDRYLDAFKRMENHPLYNGSFPAGIVIQSMQELRDAVASALTAVEPAQVPSGWQPIETAPKDGTPVLCFRADDKFSPETGLDVLWFEPSIQRWLYNGEPVWNPPTHWMPLPAAPTAGGGDD